MIAAKGLVVRYPGADADALSNVDFSVDAGALTAVLGPNGSGKSTLMRTLLGTIQPTAGEATVADRPVSSWDRRELARTVGVVSQSETISFPISVVDLVEMGRYPYVGSWAPFGDQDRAAVTAAIETCDLVSLRRRDVDSLSGGEFQRARIARALAQQPKALLLDEPTASLDLKHQMAIMEVLRRSADDGMAVVLVTHDLDLAGQFADEIVLLDAGVVAAHGPPSAVLIEETVESVYDWPVRVNADPVNGRPRVTPLRSGTEAPAAPDPIR